jgi:uncharacterized surface protein with fasciclin (FAS1) repeats
MRKLIMAAAACALVAGCGGGDGNTASDNGNQTFAAGGNGAGGKEGGQAGTHILDTLSSSGEHATFVNAINSAGLTETLSGSQPYTVFAPTEAAFQKLPAGATGGLLAPEARGQLTALLTGHIVPGTVTAEDLSKAIERGKGKAQLATVGGTSLSFSRSGDAILVTDAKGGQGRLSGTERAASNGVIHSVDAVLMPR